MKEKLKNKYKGNLFILKQIFNADPKRFLFQFLDTLISNMLNIFYSVIFFQIVLNIINLNKNFLLILKVVVLSLVLTGFGILYTNWFKNIYSQKSNFKILKSFNGLFYKKIMEIDLEEYENEEFYNKYIKAFSEINTGAFIILDLFNQIINSLISLFMLLGVIIILDKFLIIAILLLFLILIKINNKLNKIIYNYEMDSINIGRKFEYLKRTIYLKDFSKDYRVTNIYNIISKKINNLMEENKNLIDKYSLKISVLTFMKTILQNYFINYFALLYGLIKFFVLKNTLIGDLVALINATNGFSNILLNMSNKISEFNKSEIYSQNLFEIINLKSKLTSSNNIKKIPNDFFIELDNVNFSYNSSTSSIINNLNFKINKGEKIAIVGYNGSGKSTFLKLLLRLYDVKSGEIKVSGINIREFDIDFYRSLFSPMFQDFSVYPTSIENNIKMNEEKNDTIYESAHRSGLLNIILELPQKFKSELTKEFSDKGIVLSKGGLQKIALARAFYSNNKIMIFDEPSSALDPLAEKNLIENIFKYSDTLIFISHRLLCTINADRIYVMNKGNFIEIGDHNELMTKKGMYYDMFKKQTKNFLRKDII